MQLKSNSVLLFNKDIHGEICKYLDIFSLYALYRTCKYNKRLTENRFKKILDECIESIMSLRYIYDKTTYNNLFRIYSQKHLYEFEIDRIDSFANRGVYFLFIDDIFCIEAFGLDKIPSWYYIDTTEILDMKKKKSITYHQEMFDLVVNDKQTEQLITENTTYYATTQFYNHNKKSIVKFNININIYTIIALKVFKLQRLATQETCEYYLEKAFSRLILNTFTKGIFIFSPTLFNECKRYMKKYGIKGYELIDNPEVKFKNIISSKGFNAKVLREHEFLIKV